MIKTIHHQPGQSIYDLCNQAYGTLDLLVKFCRDNNVSDLSAIPQGADYKYDTDLVQMTGVNYPYASEPVSSEVNSTCSVPSGLVASVIGADSLTFTWDAVPSLSYEYAYNTSGTTPTSGIPTTSTTRVLTGLSEMTTYHFFVRAVCAPGVYSAWSSVAQATTYAPPAPPIDTHLIASFFADDGLVVSGSDVTSWVDLTDENNDMAGSGVYPSYVAEGINGLPSVDFTVSSVLETAAGMSGISGLDSISVFMVASLPIPSSTSNMVSMAVDPSLPTGGEFTTYTQYPALQIEATLLSGGNVGVNSGVMTDIGEDTPVVLDFEVDFSLVGAAEQVIYKDGSSADYSGGTVVNNTGTFTSSPLRIGGFVGRVSALLIYDKKLNNTERTNVFTYLQTRYGI
jgi:hypothetical protein